MDATFAFFPVNNHSTYPQYNCHWHPFKEVSPGASLSQAQDAEAKAAQPAEDSDRKSGSSDAPGPTSSKSSASSGAYDWSPHGYSETATSRRQASPPCLAGQSPRPPPESRSKVPSPRKRLTARRLRSHSRQGQGHRGLHSWDAPWGYQEEHEGRREPVRRADSGRLVQEMPESQVSRLPGRWTTEWVAP
jgi:hypothetical protein